MGHITTIVKKHALFIKYFLTSATVTLLDILVSRVSEHFVSEVMANTLGVIMGFVVQYILCSKKVFKKSGTRTFIIFLTTWLLGLLCADLIVYVVRVLLFDSKTDIIYFFIGKGASIAIPFFITYFIRKKLLLQEESEQI